MERYRSVSGTSAGNVELESITEDLKSIVDNLETKPARPNTRQLSKLELTLEDLATKSKTAADELLVVLDDLKVRGRCKRLDSFIQAVRSIGKERKIQDLQKVLKTIERRLNTCLVAMISNRDSSIASTLNHLSDQHEKMGVNTIDMLQSMKKDLLTSLNESTTEIKDTAKINLSTLTQESEKSAAQQSVLRSLKYDMMRTRHHTIETAHKTTFDWIFESSSTRPFPQVKFLKWLRNHHGVYWVAGKAGSGKSTLMKYLYQHERTTEALKEWAGEKKLVTASHFFWINGKHMQRSQEGLLCSLLDDILTQCPALIPDVASSRWQDFYQHRTRDTNEWLRNELLEAFAQLRTQDKISAKFCFFVDGLDEYEGDHAEIVKVLKDLSSSTDIKICLSSRPWNIFEYSFGGHPDRMLMLQDLTREDIELYIRERLERDPRFEEYEDELEEEDSYTKTDLVVEIVDMAQGVFLWIFLVVRDLLEGLTNTDRPKVLQTRLRLLPQNLEEYFMAMLNRVNRVYHEQTAQILQIILAANEPPTLMTLSYLEMIDPDYSLKASIKASSEADILKRCSVTKTRVKARGSDLLEIIDEERTNVLSRHRVVFLHRTVRDFLLTNDIQKILEDRIRTPFDINLYLCKAFLAQMKLDPKDGFYYLQRPLMDLLDDFMYYAQQSEESSGSIEGKLLDEVDRVLAFHWNNISSKYSTRPEWTSLAFEGEYPEGWVRALAIQWGICSYISQNWTKSRI